MAIEKIKILGAVLELPEKQQCNIHRENGPNRLNWQCCLAGSSKMAPRILIFSMAMGADYSFEPISIETYAPQFIGYDKLFLGSVASGSDSISFQFAIFLCYD
jgi:hypothetical protein